MIEEILEDEEYYKIIEDILNSNEFQKRKNFKHHNDSVYTHSIKVSYKSYKLSKKLKLDYKSTAIAGLLHDLYSKPWQNNKIKKNFFKQHGFTHAKEASINASNIYSKYMNDKILNSIKCHMFPLNIVPPKYIEGWIITTIDKFVSMEIFLHPLSLYKYIGIKENNKVINNFRRFYIIFTLFL